MITDDTRAQSSESADAHMRQALREKQLRFLVANLRISVFAGTFNATVFLAVLYDFLPSFELVWWYGILLSISALRMISLALFRRAFHRFSLRQWSWIFVAGACASGVVWGSSAWVFFAQLTPEAQAFYILLMGGNLTGAAIYLSQYFPCFVAFAIPHILPIHAVLLGMSANSFYLSIAAMLFIYTMMMFIMAERTKNQFETLTMLQLRNVALVEKLNESEYLFRTLTEHSTSGVALVRDERFLYVNPAIEDITGYARQDLLHARFWELIDPEHRDMIRAKGASRINGDIAASTLERSEFKIRRKDGATRWIEYTPSVVDFQGSKAILGVCSDITDRILAQQAMQESQERYRVLFETANDAMYTVGLDESGRLGRFLDANTLGCVCLGYERHELLGLSLADITYLYELKYAATLRERLRREGHAVYEASHIARDKSLLPVEVSAKIFSHQGRQAVLCIARDISERKEAQVKLEAAKKQADEANQAKSEFLANMSHEIRTPLNGLLGMLELVRMGDLDAERSRYLDVATNSGANLLTIINDILDLSKIEAGKFELLPEVFDAHALVLGVGETFRFSAQSRGVELSVHIGEDMPRFITADQVRLRQVLYNLIGNAVKFTPQGEIELGLALLSRDGQSGEIEIQVRDTGIGIAKSQQAGLFEPFVQASSASKVRGSGTGLGLSIVKRIVGFMRGSVRLESEPGQGTRVFVRVMVEFPEQVSEVVLESARGGAFCPVAKNSLRILVAEDNNVNQLMLVKLLEKLGHEAVCALDGEETLERLREGVFDCVLMDIQMPGLDGTDVTRLIRNRALPEIDPNIPIIALTAYALSGDREKFLAQGMNDYLSKPVSMAELSAALCRIVPRGDA